MLDIIPRRGSQAFQFFHQALVETGQQELANILMPELAVQPQMKKSEPFEETRVLDKKSALQPSVSSTVAEKSLPLPSKHF